jgi:hypothetical protein
VTKRSPVRRLAIYDLDYEIEATSTEGVIPAAIARYAKTQTAQTNRHCSPDRLTRGPRVAEGREWEGVLEKSRSRSARHLGGCVSSKCIQGSASIQANQLAALYPEPIAEPA